MKELERIRNVNAEGKEWLGMEKQMKDWASESVGESEEHPTSLSIRLSSAVWVGPREGVEIQLPHTFSFLVYLRQN